MRIMNENERTFFTSGAESYDDCSSSDINANLTRCFGTMCMESNYLGSNAPEHYCETCEANYPIRVKFEGSCVSASECNTSGGSPQTLVAKDGECECIDDNMTMVVDNTGRKCIAMENNCLFKLDGTCEIYRPGYKDNSGTSVKEDCSSIPGCSDCFMNTTTNALQCFKCQNTHAFNKVTKQCEACIAGCNNCELVAKVASGATSSMDNCEYVPLCNTDDQC